jgi:arylsulfatase A-like enzyme
MRLLLVLLLAALAACGNPVAEEPIPDPSDDPPPPTEPYDGPPNVVLIVADDLGWHDLGAYGNAFHETPNLDRMAAEGLRLTHGYAASPICSPSRAALMTGQSPTALGITEHFRGTPPVEQWQRLIPPTQPQNLPHETTTVAELASDAGYVTGHIGKWHLGYGGSLPQDHGFDVNIAGSGRGLPPTFFYPYLLGNPSQDLLGNPVDPAREGEYLTDRLGAEAVDFVEAHADTTFFLHLAFYAPHVPIEGPPAKVRKYRAKAATGDYGFENPEYAAMVEAIDDNVGRVLDALERLGLAGRTLVVFHSDNGGLSVEEVPAFAAHTPATGNGPLRAGKGYLYEGGTRVPFIAWGPGLVAPGTSDAPVTNMDLLPTVTDWIGAPTPGVVEGVSLRGLFATGAPPARDVLTWYFPHYSPQGTRPARSIREGDLKFLEKMEFERPFLYDLAADPGETTNLADLRPAEVERLRARLDAILDAQDARMPARNPTYDSTEPVPDRWDTPNS